MNASRLTAEQLAPMSVVGTSIALASGAGCGKTTVLTERFLSLLEGDGRLPLSRIVALTFTEKAARQLRERVRTSCRRRIEAGVDPSYWRRILRGLETARISTFHSFCTDILRQYAIEAGIDPAFAVLDESLAPTIRDRSLDTCVRRWLAARDPDFAALAVDYGLGSIREALGDILEKRPPIDLDVWSALEPSEVVARWEAYQTRLTSPLLANFAEVHRGLLNYLAANTSTHTEMAARCAKLIAKFPVLPIEANAISALEEIRANAMVKGAGTKRHWESEDVYNHVRDSLKSVRDEIDSLIKLLAPDEGRSLAAAESGVRLARLTRDAISAYDEAKFAAGLLDFHDLQDRVRKVLRHGPPSVRDGLRSSIDAVLVDEFQDTDAVQAEILETIAGEGVADGRLFLVGDAKQSIYRFRGAEPAIFQSFRERFPSEGQLNLTENFRSVPAIIGFVNCLFADVFPGDEHRLRASGHAMTWREDDDPPVEFLWAGAAEKADVGATRKGEATALARMLALRLTARWKVRDPESGFIRDARPGDIALLFRSRSDFPIYEQALAATGLDYHVVGGSTYFAKQEVIDLINLLSAIEDPLDALALAGVLRGPFFGVSDEGLYWLSTAGTDGLVATFASPALVKDSLAPDDAIAVARALETLRRWRDRKDTMPIAELLDRALNESGFEAALMGEFLGDRKRANVRKLVGLARKFDGRGSLTLADFVARLRADVRNPPREEEAATSDEAGQAVRLMTIHQAKGLEFPIVVLADLDRRKNHRSDLITHHRDLGFLISPRGDADGDESATRNLGRDLVTVEEARASEAEEIRVFYVASTRARDALILSAGLMADEAPKSPAMQLLAKTFDLTTGLSLAEPVPGEPTARARVIDPNPNSTSNPARPARFRPKLLLTARTIESASMSIRDAEPTVFVPRASFVDLTATEHSTPSLRDVDRLVRAVLNNPAAYHVGDAQLVVEQAAERLGMLVPSRIEGHAIDRVLRWQTTAARQELAGSETVRHGVRWSLPWPHDDDGATVFAGQIDFARRDATGSWHLIQITVCEPTIRDRLNVLLAAHALTGHGIAPVVTADIVTLCDEPRAERLVDFARDVVDRAVAAFA